MIIMQDRWMYAVVPLTENYLAINEGAKEHVYFLISLPVASVSQLF